MILLSIGSNLGDRVANIKQAVSLLACECAVLRVSSYYETEPYGVAEQGWFINSALQIETNLLPIELLSLCKSIELQIGRTPAPRWTERVIDIDILLYDNVIIDTSELTIPHKYMHLRNFVLVPCNEIATKALHPTLNKTISELLSDCEDGSIVRLFNDK